MDRTINGSRREDMSRKFTAVILLVLWGLSTGVLAESTATQFARSVVKIESAIEPTGRTVAMLGSERSGSGVVLDSTGLIVTVGYLLLEAREILVTFGSDKPVAAEIVVNDHATGLALLTSELPPDIVPLSLGDSALIGIEDDVVVLPHGGTDVAHVTRVADIREFAGSWEYLIDRAIYTAPATRVFSGAALINRDAELIGIGSLLLSNVYSGGPHAENRAQSVNGNLFIPVEHLQSSMGHFLNGQPSVDARPWLGTILNEAVPDLEIVRVAEESPAAMAGLQQRDKIISINNIRVTTMADFYQQLWDGQVGDSVDLLIVRQDRVMRVAVSTADRSIWLR